MNERPEVLVEVVQTPEQRAEGLAIRRVVFIEEQGVPESEEIDRYDSDAASRRDAVYVLARTGGRAVGTGRLLLDEPPGANAHIGRVAVLAEWRRHGVGRAVMAALEAEARDRRVPGITLGAQLHAIPFYERLGYVARDAVFLDAGIEHRWMDKPLEYEPMR